MVTPSISKSTTTRLCPTGTLHSLTRPRTSLTPMVTRMHRTDSPVRGTPCQPDLFWISDSLRPSALGFRIAAFGLALLLFLVPACKPKEVRTLLGPSQALSSVLAEEAARLAGAKKQVALITADTSWGPPSTVEEALKRALKKHGLTVVTAKAAN